MNNTEKEHKHTWIPSDGDVGFPLECSKCHQIKDNKTKCCGVCESPNGCITSFIGKNCPCHLPKDTEEKCKHGIIANYCSIKDCPNFGVEFASLKDTSTIKKGEQWRKGYQQGCDEEASKCYDHAKQELSSQLLELEREVKGKEMPSIYDGVCKHKMTKSHTDGFACGWNEHARLVLSFKDKVLEIIRSKRK